MTAPDPLTPADCDLRDFAFMPFEVRRFRDSDLVSFEEPEVVLAAIMLWSASWHQVPAASLPDDDRALAQFAGYGRATKEWKRVREGALRNFIKCSDGRLYHTTVAKKAVEAWQEKLAYRDRKARRTEAAKTAADARWHDAERMNDQCEPHPKPMRTASGNNAQRNANDMPKGTGTGTGTVKPKPTLNHESQTSASHVHAHERPPPGINSANDALGYVCIAAGWHPATDTQRQTAISIINGWLASGCSLELILDAIAKARRRDPSQTKSLKRFDSTIRGMRRDQLGGELPPTEADVEELRRGLAKRLAVG